MAQQVVAEPEITGVPTWHAMSVEEAVTATQTDLRQGLGVEEAERRLIH